MNFIVRMEDWRQPLVYVIVQTLDMTVRDARYLSVDPVVHGQRQMPHVSAIAGHTTQTCFATRQQMYAFSVVFLDRIWPIHPIMYVSVHSHTRKNGARRVPQRVVILVVRLPMALHVFARLLQLAQNAEHRDV